MSKPLPIAVLVSGVGTNLQALLDRVHGKDAEIVAVGSSVADAPALARASERDVPARAFVRSSYGNRDERDRELAGWLQERGARLVVLAGYMELLGDGFLASFPGAVMNVHPSLLPAFPGTRAVEQALEYGVRVFGVTVHFVDAGVDTGPVILQGAVELPDARGADEVMTALRPIEHRLLAEAVSLFAQGRIAAPDGHSRRVVIRAPEG